MFSSYTSPRVRTKSFSLLQNAFLQAADLPFHNVLTEEEIDAAFVAEDACFGEDKDDVYTPALTLWGWLAQAMHAEKARSCVAAVARIATLCVALGREPPSPDTGAYCRARAKLSEAVLRRLVYTVGDGLESQLPADWLWLGHHVKLGDGTTLLTPDTDENQKAWPQAHTQKPGLGFPILRILVLLSLATAALCGLAIGPYKGKETGETALLRELLDRFQRGDVFLGDCAYCSYFMLALLLARGVHVVTRQHQARQTDFRSGQRLGKDDHVVAWERPARPEWMDEDTYSNMPETLTLRELRVHVDVPGFRVRELIVVTTLTDAERYPQEELARLFRMRWHVELDLRNIKTSLRLDDLRGKRPETIRREIWIHWLAYNLIRKVTAQAALKHEKLPRELSFVSALAAVTGAWALASTADASTLSLHAQTQHRGIAWLRVGHRPNRVEPRAIKRRPKSHKFLTKPRKEARAELMATKGTCR
jgi:putative transposase